MGRARARDRVDRRDGSVGLNVPHGIFAPDLAKLYVEDAGRQYTPSNGTEGSIFLESWCGECARDRSMRDGVDIDECEDNERCDIIAASFRGEAKEWVIGADGQPRCTQYVSAGEPVPAPRCAFTMELPL